ncbi:MAG: MFS transporter [Caldilineaceae bacterium]|nr:MFS transporter [Caldilineaceae bacterium]
MNLKRLSAVSVGHLSIDILNSSVAMILTVLAVPFAISNAQIGFGVMLYSLVGSLSQPFFGLLADRLSGRWLGAVGLLWTATFYAGATFAENYTFLLVMMTLASLGSGAFHPQGAMVASAAGKTRASSATAIFFLLGQMGLALGPIIAGFVLQSLGLAGARTIAIASLPVVAWMALSLHRPIETATEAAPAQPGRRPAPAPSVDRRLAVILAFGLLVALRATVQQSYYGLLPKFFADQGFEPAVYGFLVGVFSIALAVGTLVGGILGDQLDHRKLLMGSMLITTPFTYAMLVVNGWPYYILSTLAGFLLGIPHSVLVVMAQKLLPKRQGLASGAVLGFMFATGAAGTGLVGWVADFVGMAAALRWVALIPFLAGISAFFLAKQPQPQPVAVTSPVAGSD